MNTVKGKKKIRTAAIILAGGSGKRMHSDVPKQYMEVCGRPLIYFTLKAFEESSVDDIVLVVNAGDEEMVRDEYVSEYGFKKIGAITAGGKERFNSSANGLKAVREIEAGYLSDNDTEVIVLIHDAARAMITPEVIERTVCDAAEYGACAAGVLSKDTVKIAGEDGFVSSTPSRDRVWIVQTPQSFRYELISKAYERMFEGGDTSHITDDAMVAEQFSDVKVRLTEGSYENIKVTTPDDLITAEKILSARG
ncbi:MAG: 2-C-methyl-D-erythritol 4-phosphate cytidylyltransferase [Lachnospiraceae bacterium]|nr:2-C-methyl-D-erythritol 4-phosphate cytidylyltransferase [Lachnospiraceae bacterium]